MSKPLTPDSSSLAILLDLCSQPTAPFAEQEVVGWVERFAAARPGLRLRRDRYGNLLIERVGTARGPRWVFAAHMDHPGFVAVRMLDDKRLLARFHGYVTPDYLANARVRFQAGDLDVPARMISIACGESARPGRVDSAVLQVAQFVPAGTPGMFDLGTARVRRSMLHSRVCDDLAGAAACLAMLDRLQAGPPPAATVAVLLSRAEEEGFIGAIAAASKPSLLRKSDLVLSIETSSAQPAAPLGGGAVVRVGDRTSVFDSALTYFLSSVAADLAKQDGDFTYQRALMSGGTCEATAYGVFGFHAASLCVPLGNYHNMNTAGKKLAAEFISLHDWTCLLHLFERVAHTGHTFRPGHGALKSKFGSMLREFGPLLVSPRMRSSASKGPKFPKR